MGPIASLLGTRRRRLAAAAVVVLIAAATWYFARGDTDADASTTTTAEATVSTVQDTVSGSGTLEALKSSTLTFSSSGRVTEVAVAEGDTVRKGETLASIDTTALDAALASAQAQLAAAQSTAANDGSESAAQQAANTARVDSAAAAVAEAQDALDEATLKAPFSGMVASVGYEVGDRVGSSVGGAEGGSSGGAGGGSSAGSTATTEAEGITVITPRRFVLTADVSAGDVERIAKGMQAQITPAGATEPVFGTVRSVGRVAQTDTDGTATFPVTIALTGEQEDLYAGTSADVSIIVESRDDVLTVPTAAVTTAGDTTYVMKVTDGKATKAEVEIGDTVGMTTEIVSGLEEGDTVQYEQTMRRPGGGNREGDQGETPGGDFPGGGMPDGGPPAMPGGRG